VIEAPCKKEEKLIDIINQIHKCGWLDLLDRNGLLSSKTKMYRNMYLKYQAYLSQGIPSKKSAIMVANHFRYQDERTVYRAIQIMTMEVD